jgi:tetratricopeptide (TPR) repeat protein
MMGWVTALICVFLAGLFVGEELLHQPQVTASASLTSTPATDPQAAADPHTPAPGGGTNGTPAKGHDDSTFVAAINQAKDPAQLLQMGRILSDENRADLAILAFQRAVDLGDHSVVTYRSLATAQLVTHKVDDAERNLRIALREDPKDGASHVVMGFLLGNDRGQLEAARKELQTALSLNLPNDLKTQVQAELNKLNKS